MRCPICSNNKTTVLLKIKAGNFDGSSLYSTIKIATCKKCGHIFNVLTNKEICRLSDFYNHEYAPSNIGSSALGGDKPGGSNKLSLRRYENLYNLIKRHIDPSYRILDGGCAVGGFLDFLKQLGYKNLYGIDVSREFVKIASRGQYKIRSGSVESIPFSNNSFDLVVIDNVMEHLANPREAFKEAKRTLSDNGLLCISVPDASRYGKNDFFDFYYFLLREHIQHFDIGHLKIIARWNGFKLVDYSRTSTSLSEKMVLPILTAVFRLIPIRPKKNTKINYNHQNFRLKKIVQSYINNSTKSVERKKPKIQSLINSQVSLYAYGISNEFLYLYELGLRKCKIVGFIDDTPFKQKKLKIDGIKIEGKSVLKNTSPESRLIVTAFAHISKMKSNLKEIGYPGKIISL